MLEISQLKEFHDFLDRYDYKGVNEFEFYIRDRLGYTIQIGEKVENIVEERLYTTRTLSIFKCVDGFWYKFNKKLINFSLVEKPKIHLFEFEPIFEQLIKIKEQYEEIDEPIINNLLKTSEIISNGIAGVKALLNYSNKLEIIKYRDILKDTYYYTNSGLLFIYTDEDLYYFVDIFTGNYNISRAIRGIATSYTKIFKYNDFVEKYNKSVG